jgi:ubiquinol-cytochrome c reductase cytochrome c1 subunit
MMKRIVIAAVLCSAAGIAAAAAAAGGHGAELLSADVNLSNKTSLQRGARLFVNYCLSCHSAKYMRYNRMADDLELGTDAVEENLMFASEKVGDTMTVAMQPADAETWFGIAPPDLTVIARSRGADWLYSFLNGFYRDETRPTGVNNLYFPDTAMPHVLWELQGVNRLVEDDAGHGEGHESGPHFEQVVAGRMDESQYRTATRDLVAFLVYMGEPAKLVRYRIGFWVIVFLFVLLIATYLMKREYWKDVH